MGKVTVTFESATNLPDGPVSFTYAVDDVYDPDLKGALLASARYGKYEGTETQSVQETVDAQGNPVMVDREFPVTLTRTFTEALRMFSKDAIGDRVTNAVNQYRVAKANAIALAKAGVPPPVEMTEGDR